MRIKQNQQKIFFCPPPPPPKFCSKNFSDFLYNEDNSISFTKQEKIGMSSNYFFQSWAKTIIKYGKIHTHLIHLDERNLIIISQ